VDSIFDPKKARKMREAAGLTQTAVAAALGKSVSTISNWESGTSEPDVTDYYRLRKLYRCKDMDLLSGEAELQMIPNPA